MLGRNDVIWLVSEKRVFLVEQTILAASFGSLLSLPAQFCRNTYAHCTGFDRNLAFTSRMSVSAI